MNKVKLGIYIALAAVTLFIVAGCFSGLVGKNDDQNYQVIQSLTGNMSVRDKAGFYPRYFATVTTYPKAVQAYYSADDKEGGRDDESIRATFNDGGLAQVSTIVRFRMPILEEERLLIHREFTANVDNAIAAVRAHLINCTKATATMMTASENQTSRKAEFAKVIGDQLQNGLYCFRRVEKPDLDINGQPKLADNGKQITTFATEIILDTDNKPLVDQESPLKQYGIQIAQFSVTQVEYDNTTRDQFAKKKEASLAAELAKIEVEQAKQETIAVSEEGKRKVAEKEAEMNVQIAESKGTAEMLVAKAEQEKLEAQEVKEKAIIEATQKFEVAEIEKKAAKEEAEKMITLAEAKEKEIALAGFITEKEQLLAEIAAKRDVGVAAEICKLQLPRQIVMTGGSNGSGGGGANELFSVMGVNQTIDLMNKLSVQEPAAVKK